MCTIHIFSFLLDLTSIKICGHPYSFSKYSEITVRGISKKLVE